MKRLKAKKALCVALAMSLTMPILPVNAVSSDINGHWAQKTISQWEEKGLISGYKDGTFKPNKEVTRAEFVHILNLALKLTKQGEVKFADVKQGDWFYKDIEIAVGEGYAKGTPENKFMPNATLTRAEAAVFIANILKEKSEKQLSFKDVDMIPSWAKQAIALMVEKGYMTGYPDNTFSARKNLTRAEAVTILDKVISQVQVSKKEEKKEEKKQVPVAVEEQKAVQAKKSSGGGGGGGGGGGSSTPSIPNALGAKTVKNAQELEAAVSSGYNKITVDATGKIERDVNLSYSPKQELEITINKAQDKLNNIKITAPNTTKITLKDDGVQDNGTVLDNLKIDAPNAHVESSFAVDTVEIVRVASSTFKALDKVTTIKVQNEAKIEIGKDVVVKPNVEIQTDKEVKLVGKYNKVTTTKDSEIRLEEGTKIEEYTTSMTASQSMITGGEIEKITAQSNLTIKDTKVKDIEIPSTTNKKLTMNVQGNAVVKKIVNNSAYNLKLNTEKVGQVEDTSQAKLEKNQVESVSISGTPKAGQKLTAITSPSNADVTYKWQISNTGNEPFNDIAGATAKTYTLTSSDEDKYVRVVATGKGNFEGTKTSSAVKIAKEQNPQQKMAVKKVSITGDNEIGKELIANVEPSGATVTYQWMIADTENGSYTAITNNSKGQKYTVTKDDAGKFIKVEVTGTGSYEGKVLSDNFAPIETLKNVSSVTIEGTKKVDGELTAKVTPETAKVTYQWQSSDDEYGTFSDIRGATDKTYRVESGKKFIKVKVTNKYDSSNIAESGAVKIEQRSLQLDVNLKPSIDSLKTNIKVTTEASLTPSIDFKYEITNAEVSHTTDALLQQDFDRIKALDDLQISEIIKETGQDLEIKLDDILAIEKNNNRYLTVYEIDKDTKKLLAYSSIKLRTQDIKLPKKEEWNVHYLDKLLEEGYLFVDRGTNAQFVKDGLKVKNEKGADVTQYFDIKILRGLNPIDDYQKPLEFGSSIIVTPKADLSSEYKYIYSIKNEEKNSIHFKYTINSLKFIDKAEYKVGDTIKVQILAEANTQIKSLEDWGEVGKYNFLTYKWFKIENGNEVAIDAPSERGYTLKERDKGIITIGVKVKGDGIGVLGSEKSITKVIEVK